MKRVGIVYVLAFVVFFFVGAALAQEAKPTTEKPDPMLTEAQSDRFDKLALLLERSGVAASPDEIGREIGRLTTQLVAERQKAAQEASAALSEFYKTLAVEGYRLNPQTKKYEKLDEKK